MATVADAMTKDVLTVDPADTIGEAAEKMQDANVGAKMRAVAVSRPEEIPGLVDGYDVVGVDEVPDGTMRMVWVDEGDPVLVVHTGGEFRALQGTCSHEYFELDKGFLTAGTLTCALHLSRFDLESGEALERRILEIIKIVKEAV